MEKSIFDKIKEFTPINSNAAKNNKGFRITKNGMDTGIFKKNEANNNINNIIQNNTEEQGNVGISQIMPHSRIHIVPNSIINEEEN